ncbi:MAG: cysteine hydrolase [candidate division Zixibacteria bacterium]|nr:cysteine hydrolase [candidate division Zixibacteria bacterium]
MSKHEKLKSEVNPKYLNVDPLKESYRESIIEHPDRTEAIKSKNIALLCIDMQYLDAAPGHGVFADIAKSTISVESQEYYFKSLEKLVLPNVRRLQDCFRRHGLEVVHIRIQSLTRDGRDRSNGHKQLGLLAPPGSKEAEFLELVAPADDEIVINKTASGVFTATNLYYVLKNLNIDSVWVTGVYTEECVSTTVRDASDLGFFVTLIEDGCTSVTPELHSFTIATLKDRYTRVIDTDAALTEIEKYIRA